ncbi:MAG: TauD/TfdA family dioxygenase [Gammaproteobacteria bacterium]
MFLSSKSSKFLKWASQKENNIPKNINEISVEIKDINRTTKNEISKIRSTLDRFNSCLYRSNRDLESNSCLLDFAKAVGMKTFDCNNIEANEISTISSIKNEKIQYIPYTNKALNWHTDGYYDKKPLFSWLLHCINPADDGGENYLLDHELAMREYVLSHDDIEVLMNKRAITIPESQGSNRSELSTYIFSFDNDYEKLHMRFSMRKENIKMSDNTLTAMSKLTNVIENNCSKYSITYKLSKNEGILSNNILHGRNSFKDDKVQRKLLRIRSYERL